MKCAFFLSFLISALVNQGVSIRITRFVVPSVANLGSLLELDCAYDLENDELYDVKWYKDAHEFFRCKSNGEVQAFDVDGITIYYNKLISLGSCPVTLSILNLKSSGHYRCEISTEAPQFQITAQSMMLKVSNIAPLRRTQSDDDPTHSTSTKASQVNGHPHFTSSKILKLLVFSFLIVLK